MYGAFSYFVTVMKLYNCYFETTTSQMAYGLHNKTSSEIHKESSME